MPTGDRKAERVTPNCATLTTRVQHESIDWWRDATSAGKLLSSRHAIDHSSTDLADTCVFGAYRRHIGDRRGISPVTDHDG